MLSGKIVVITGGAGLLGREFCTAVSKHGGVAIVADLDYEAALRVAEQINQKYPDRADAVRLDITDVASVCEAIETVNVKHGSINAVVNNAYPRNRNYGRKLEEVTYSDFCDNVNMNLGGYFLVSQQFAMFFKKQGHGNIVNLGSIYGSIAPRFDIYDGTSMTMPVEYAAIKSAVSHLTRYFSQYFKGSGLRVNTLSPGGIKDRQPESFLKAYADHCGGKGMLEARHIVGTLLFLLSDDSRYMNGQNLVVDDGFSL